VWFKCDDGHWTDLESTCLRPGQCKDMSLGPASSWSEMQVGNDGDVLIRDCNVGALTAGSMRFECRHGSWISDTSECRLDIPAGMACPSRDLMFTKSVMGTWMSAYEQDEIMQFRVPASPAGIVTVDCGSGYDGWASFQCRANGTWSLLRSRKATTCWAGASRISWNDEYLRCKKNNGKDCKE
jgi:hypothetical protein